MSSPSKLRFGKELNDLELNDIQSLINEQIDESQNLDYKQPSQNPQKDSDNLAEVMASFLNTDGGIIVYGISEKREGENRCPDKIIWCSFTKERLENLLISRIQPWEERIRIHRIANDDDAKDGIFVVQVPKSNNPPHMFNHVYYQRMNFQTKPMEHESVYRAFQTSWIRRRDLAKSVIEPLYSEIKRTLENLTNYEIGETGRYEVIRNKNRYLFDQLEPGLMANLENFYERIEKISLLYFQIPKIAVRIFNEELVPFVAAQEFFIQDNPYYDGLRFNVKIKDASGMLHQHMNISANYVLFKRQSIDDFLQSKFPSDEIIEYTPLIRGDPLLTPSKFKEYWLKCEKAADTNKQYILAWEEMKQLIEVGETILRNMT